MTTSFIYKNAWVYEALMMALYGSAYHDRYRAMSDCIPHSASVTDLCCGPATLFRKHLRHKGIQYTGLDINPGFVQTLSAQGGMGLQWDMSEDKPLPEADYVLMHASLYHFLPDPAPVVERMRQAARKQVLIAEPIRNVADSTIPLLAFLAKKFTNPGTGEQARRFTETTLDRFFAPYQNAGAILDTRLIAGGREKLYILQASN